MELLTVNETADLLRVSPMTVRRYIKAGRLPAVRIGRGVRVRKEDAEHLPLQIRELDEPPEIRNAKPFTMDDPLWNLVGMFDSPEDAEVSANKYKYLADAYADLHETPETSNTSHTNMRQRRSKARETYADPHEEE